MLGRNIGKIGNRSMDQLYALVEQEMDETQDGATEDELIEIEKQLWIKKYKTMALNIAQTTTHTSMFLEAFNKTFE